MNLVGNDVVDLGDDVTAHAHERARFVERVCHPEECAWVAGAEDPRELLWSLFAAKEAAYKVLVKRAGEGERPLLAHRRYRVRRDLRRVRFGDAELELAVQVLGPCVHAVAWLGAPPEGQGVAVVPAEEDPSVTARRALLEGVGGWPGLQVVREERPGSWDGFGPPKLVRGGKVVPVDVSLSHDGRFAAWAVGPRESSPAG